VAFAVWSLKNIWKMEFLVTNREMHLVLDPSLKYKKYKIRGGEYP